MNLPSSLFSDANDSAAQKLPAASNHLSPRRSIRDMLPSGFRALVLFVLLAAPAVLSTAAPGNERIFTVRGIVRSTLEDGKLRIAHEPIPDFMPAMTMPFNVDPSALDEAARLKVGDGVRFKFAVGKASRIYDLEHLGPRRTEDEPRRDASAPVRRLKEGAAVPPFVLVDQLGRPVTETDLRGKRTVLTFIFTRCPVPEFCPLMSQRFAEIQDRIVQSPPVGPEVQLLSITIDPEFDTPAVLKSYGESFGANPARWRFATGTPEQIVALTRAFAVHTEQSRGTLDHTLATALIDPDGRVTAIWRGNGWKVNEVLAALTPRR